LNKYLPAIVVGQYGQLTALLLTEEVDDVEPTDLESSKVSDISYTIVIYIILALDTLSLYPYREVPKFQSDRKNTYFPNPNQNQK
jgi:hypothetical protein